MATEGVLMDNEKVEVRPPTETSTPWWVSLQRKKVSMVLSYSPKTTVDGIFLRLDTSEYRKYLVLKQNGNFIFINIDHIVSIEEVKE